MKMDILAMTMNVSMILHTNTVTDIRFHQNQKVVEMPKQMKKQRMNMLS